MATKLFLKRLSYSLHHPWAISFPKSWSSLCQHFQSKSHFAIYSTPQQKLILPFEKGRNQFPHEIKIPIKKGQHSRDVHLTPYDLRTDKSADPKKKSNIVYSIVPKEKSAVVAGFLINNYHQTEPITVALGMPLSEVEGWFQRFIRMCMYVSVLDITVQAVDEQAKKRVGILSSIIVDPLTSKPILDILSNYTSADKHPVNAEMNEFFYSLEHGLDPAEVLGFKKEGDSVPRVLEHLYLSVKQDYYGQGISSNMIRVAENLAQNIINCRVGYVICTSQYSYQIFTKHGYKTVREIKYADYKNLKGEPIFASKIAKLGEHTACRALVKEFPTLYK